MTPAPDARRAAGAFACALCLAVAVTARGAEDAAPSPEPPPVATATHATVYFALLPGAVEGGIVRDAPVKRMVDAVVMAAAGKPDIASAWRFFVRPEERVGIKVSATGAPVCSTHPDVVEAVAEGLLAAGVPARNIVVWDRLDRDLANAGFKHLAERFRVTGTDRAGGYAKEQVITAAVMGKLIIGDLEFVPGPGDKTSSRSHLSSVLVRDVDKVVHVPALADSVFSGVNGALAGMVLDNADNRRRLARAPHYGDPFLPEAYADPRIGGKVVLTILDALRPQYSGGPFPGAGFNVNYGAIFASRDAVAIDATGVRLLDEFRKDAGLAPLAKSTRWLESAELMGLGFAAADKIKLVRTGLESEVRWNQP